MVFAARATLVSSFTQPPAVPVGPLQTGLAVSGILLPTVHVVSYLSSYPTPKLVLFIVLPITNMLSFGINNVLLAFAGAVLPLLSASPHPLLGNGIPLRIMPLGASITYGLGSSDWNGYRAALRSLLLTSTPRAAAVNMVGSLHNGTMIDNDVEGWSGFRITQVHEKAMNTSDKAVLYWKPNLVLINAGTNDAAQGYQIPSAGWRMESMMRDIWEASPRATILLSTLLVNKNPTTDKHVLEINEQYVRLATRLREVAGRPVVLVDMHGEDGPGYEDIPDGTHPTDEGYVMMARLWYRGVVEASHAGFLQAPEVVEGVPDDGDVRV
ncbi:hypothetical protein VTJ49DRAFT_5223 [Mycothermus thermophilus]|uniref:SGNH hydrolase-type esterase domain-containing protein n=1 Tax=Humicola insolens TaxID=85995 RepID=A0ABR3V3Q0_HUMIN